MRARKIYAFLFILSAAVFLNFRPGFSENAAAPAKNQNADSSESETMVAESLKNIIKEAIKETDEEKDQTQVKLVAELRTKLKASAQDWITASKQARKFELNQLRHEIWDLGGMVSYPVPYDYYLRDFSYALSNSDIKTGALPTEFKGAASVLETLYVEAPHNEAADDVSKFFYTLTRNVMLTFEYVQNDFVLTDVYKDPYQLVTGWVKNNVTKNI